MGIPLYGHPFFQSESWKLIKLVLVVLVLVFAVEQLGRASISMTRLVLNDLLENKSLQDAEKVILSYWHDVKSPESLVVKTREESGLARITEVEDASLPDWYSYADEFEASAVPITRTLTFTLANELFTARYDLELALDHPLAQALKDGQGQMRPQAFVKELLGSIDFFDKDRSDVTKLHFLGPYFEVNNSNSKLHVWLVTQKQDLPIPVAVRVNIKNPSLVKLRFKPDLITVIYPEGAQASVLSSGQVIRRDEQRLIFQRTIDYYRPDLVDLTYGEIQDETLYRARGTQKVEPRQKPTVVSMLRSLHFYPPVLGLLLFALLESLPILLFLRYVSSRSVGPSAPAQNFSDYRLIAGLFLVFHFGLHILDSIAQIPDIFYRLFDNTAQYLKLFFPFIANQHVGQVVVTLVFAGYLWPRFVRSCMSSNSIALAPENIPLLRLLTVVIAGVIAIITLSSVKDLLLVWMLAAWFGIGVIVVSYSTSMLLNVTLTRQRIVGNSSLMSATMIALPVAMMLMYEPTYLSTLLIASKPINLSWLLSFVVFLAAAIPMLFYFSEVAYRAFTTRSLQQDKSSWPNWKRVALVLGIAFLAYPTRWLVYGETSPARMHEIFNLAHILDNLIRYPFLWMILVMLRTEAKTSRSKGLTPLARNMGIVMALTFFYSPTIRWMYIPIAFMLGYLVLARWLLVDNQYVSRVGSKIRANRRRIIQAIVDQKYNRRALRQLKRNLAKNADDPKFDLKIHEHKIRTLEESIRMNQAQEPLTIAGVPTSNLALSVSATSSNWYNGKRTALYSVFFALPWIILYFKDLVVNPNLSNSYFILDFLSSSLSLLVQWSLYGFFFGYFFAFIRGRDGLHKGLAYFMALVVPHLAITLIFVPAGIREWSQFGFWVLQLFTQTMLLGLVAGDYESLRRSRLGWFQLFEVHNFSALASWASSTALAIGVAISTLITSYGTDLIRTVFQLGRMAAPELPSE